MIFQKLANRMIIAQNYMFNYIISYNKVLIFIFYFLSEWKIEFHNLINYLKNQQKKQKITKVTIKMIGGTNIPFGWRQWKAEAIADRDDTNNGLIYDQTFIVGVGPAF